MTSTEVAVAHNHLLMLARLVYGERLPCAICGEPAARRVNRIMQHTGWGHSVVEWVHEDGQACRLAGDRIFFPAAHAPPWRIVERAIRTAEVMGHDET